MEMRWWLLALVALGCDAVGHKIHRASLGEAGDGLIDGSQGTFDNPLGSFDSNAETNSAAPAPVPAPQTSSQSVALTSDEKACSELLVVTGGDAMTGKKHGFNQQKFTLETKGVFNKNDTNTYMARSSTCSPSDRIHFVLMMAGSIRKIMQTSRAVSG